MGVVGNDYASQCGKGKLTFDLRRRILISVKINGQNVKVSQGSMILDACKKINVEIPTFCHDKRFVPHGACRICVVEVEGARTLLTACSTPVSEGMNINTHSKKVVNVRKDLLELIWASHDNDCLTCKKAGDCKLQDYCYEYEVEPENKIYLKTITKKIDSSNKFYIFNRDKCLLCGKCVKMCSELQGTGAIGFSERGYHTHITHPFEAGMEHSNCVSCGNCVTVCPTGALMERPHSKFRTWDITKKVKTTCTYCGVGCQINLNVKNNEVVRVDPVVDAVNQGLLCVKGKFAFNFINHKDRLKTPLIRKDGELVESTWEEAYNLIINQIIKTKKDYGPDVFAALSSARCSTEENYILQKLFRAVIGTNNVDHCARL